MADYAVCVTLPATALSMISRDPSDYRLTTHAMQQRRERNIPNEVIAEAISDGKYVDSIPGQPDNQCLFSLEYSGRAHPISVVVDPNAGKVITVEEHYMHNND